MVSIEVSASDWESTTHVHFGEYLPRRAGKTYKAVEWLLEYPTDRILIVPDERQRSFIRKLLAERTGIPPHAWMHAVFSAPRSDPLFSLRGLNKEFIVDNMDQFKPDTRRYIRSDHRYRGATWSPLLPLAAFPDPERPHGHESSLEPYARIVTTSEWDSLASLWD